LEGCLDSVTAQTYKNFEIIVVDDGSTDNTRQIMETYIGVANLRYFRQENGGQAKAKNMGLSLALGKYIAFLDADDLWEKGKLEKQIPLFSSDSVGVVYSGARYIDSSGRELDFKLSSKYLRPQRGKVIDFLLMDNFVPFSSSVVRRECFERFGVFDETLKMGIDWDLWLRISTGYAFDFVGQPLLLYRMGHAGQMSKNAEERHRCSDRILNEFVRRFPKHVKKKALRQAWSYTYMNRGYYHAQRSLGVALKFYLRAYLQWPFSLKAIIGAIKSILKRTPLVSYLRTGRSDR
jgi:glycosyltransferase involved in cell wall biosynthesis